MTAPALVAAAKTRARRLTHPDAPSLVRVTDATGTLIAVIDPWTRQRRAVNGTLEQTLTVQGWALTGAKTIAWPGHGKPPKVPIPLAGRDARHGHGGTREGAGRPPGRVRQGRQG